MNETKIKERKSLSFSEYSTYLNCQHKWYLNYYLRLPSETNEELIFGSALHSSIEKLLGSKLEKKLFNAMPEQTSRDLFVRHLKKELLDVKDLEFLKKFEANSLGRIFMFQASKLLTELNFFNRFKDYEIIDTELKLENMPIISTDEVDIVYKGFIDLILRNAKTGKYLILDWKSSGKPWDIKKKLKDNENFFAQLCLYKYFYSKLKGIELNDIETKFYNLPRSSPKEQSPYNGIITETYMNSFFENFQQTALKIFNHSQTLKNFTKQKFVTKNNFCHRCIFNTPEFCDDITEYQIIKI